MKKAIHILLIFILSIGLYNKKLNSKELSNTPFENTKLEINYSNSNTKTLYIPEQKIDNNILSSEINRFSIYSVINQYMGNAKHSPVAYEPKSGFFYIIALGSTDGNPRGDITNLFYLNPNTGQWGHDTLRINQSKFEYYLYPSISVTNPSNSNQREDHVVYTHYQFSDLDPDNPGFVKQVGARSYISALAYDYGYDYLDLDILANDGPTKNDADVNKYIWSSVDLLGIDGDNESYFYYVSPLQPATDTDRWGAFGINGFEIVSGNTLINDVPKLWGYENFLFDQENRGPLSGMPSLGNDADGNIYMAVNNIFKSQIEARTPGVSKSTDKGKTWSEFNIMPMSLLNDYAVENGFDNINIGANISYNIDAFKVIGEDSYSYIYRVNLFNTQGQLTNVHLVESLYKNNLWTINFIADLNTSTLNSISVNGSNAAFLGKNFRLETNDRGHEVETSITADGKYQVVKWVDENPEHMVVMPKDWDDIIISVGGNFQVLEGFDSLYACDIFMAWKEIGTDTWNGPFNVTNDEVNNIYTFMPDIIPSITEIPLMMMTTFDYEGTQANGLFNNIPDVFEQYIVIPIQKSIDYLVLDGTKDHEPLSVDYQENSEYIDININPNPINSQGNINFKINGINSQNVKMTLYNSLGVKVLDLFSQIVSAGTSKTIGINAENFVSGSYNLIIEIDGKILSRIIIINK